MEARPRSHPPADALRAFGLGQLDVASAEGLLRHLESCPECRHIVAGISGDDFLRRLPQAHGRDATPAPGKPMAVPPAGPRPPSAPRPAAVRDLPPELADHPQYEVLRELGRGGMGVVYLARNKLMDRLEVLKVISRAFLDRPGAVERFLREIRAAARLSHPNVVTAFSVVQQGGLLAFAMEYIDGENLASVVKAQGPLPVAHGCFYAQQAAWGLQHALERGMVHRDIKPQNLILARDGPRHVVKVLDFGLAKATREKGDEPGLTAAGQMLGTPDYIAPEQTLDAASADIRADVYSLGCTLYYLLAGQRPFSAPSVAGVLVAHQTQEARPLNVVRPDVPEALAAVVRQMMAKDPARRPQTPAEVAQALAPFVKAAAGPPGPAAEPAKPPRAALPVATPVARPAPPAAPPESPPPFAWDAVAEQGTPPAPPRTNPAPRTGPHAGARRRSRQKVLLIGGVIAACAVVLAAAALVALLAAGLPRGQTRDGTIVLDHLPPGADVLVDGGKVVVLPRGDGKPIEVPVAAGKHKLEVRRGGFAVQAEELTVASGARRPFTVRLVPLPPPGGPGKGEPRPPPSPGDVPTAGPLPPPAPGSVPAGKAESPAVAQAVARGVKFLLTQQRADGAWRGDADGARNVAGFTSLAALALLEGGVHADAPSIRKAREAVLAQAPQLQDVYNLAAAVLFLERLGDAADRPLVQTLATRLLAAQGPDGGWSYSAPVLTAAEEQQMLAALRTHWPWSPATPRPPGFAGAPAAGGPPAPLDLPRIDPGQLPADRLRWNARAPASFSDNSNTYFALIALWAARRHGLPAECPLLATGQRFRNLQRADGGWAYGADNRTTATMTCAGLVGLAAGHGALPPATRVDPRDRSESLPIQRGLAALARFLEAPTADAAGPAPLPNLYFLWCLAKVATLYDLATVGGTDWYAWGSQSLLAHQTPQGSWTGGGYAGAHPVLDTSFALMFLKRSNLTPDLTEALRPCLRVQDPGPPPATVSLAGKSVPELIDALGDPLARTRVAAAAALGRKANQAVAAVPALVRLVADRQQPLAVRLEAAEALPAICTTPAVPVDYPPLLTVMASANEPADVRLRIAWLFNKFFDNGAVMERARPFMEAVCAEAPSPGNASVRYHCAYLLALRFPQQAPASAMNVLAEWLRDTTGKLYGGKDVGGKAVITGDSRAMALQAVRALGPNRVRGHNGLVQQLRVLAADNTVAPELRQHAAAVLKQVGP